MQSEYEYKRAKKVNNSTTPQEQEKIKGKSPASKSPATNTTLNFSEQGIQFLKNKEGLRLTPYDDQTGKPITQWVKGATIGYGKLISESEWPTYKNGISEETANQLLKQKMGQYENAVKRSVHVPINQHQYDALVIFTYNIGPSNFANSSAVKIINNPAAKTPYSSLENAWKAFNKSQGKVNKGLNNRREAEWQMYSQGVYSAEKKPAHTEVSLADKPNASAPTQDANNNSSQIVSTSLLAEAIKKNQGDTTQNRVEITPINIAEASVDYVKESAKDIRKHMLNVEQKLTAYLQAPYGKKTIMKQEYFQAHRKLKEVFNQRVTQVNKNVSKNLNQSRVMTNRQVALKEGHAQAQAYKLTDTQAFKSVNRTLKRATHLGRGLVAYELCKVGDKTWKAYREGGDWGKELTEGLGETLGGLGASELFSLALVAAGVSLSWYIAIPAAIAVSMFGGFAGQLGASFGLEKVRQMNHTTS